MPIKLSELTELRRSIGAFTKKLKEADFIIEDFTELKLGAQLMTQRLYSAENHLNSVEIDIIRLQNIQASKNKSEEKEKENGK